MYLYYFMLKRYRHNQQQMVCLLKFLCMLLPVMMFAAIIRQHALLAFHFLLFSSGWCTWTFAEYILHRFWMHHKNSNLAMARTHVHHHSHPTELVVSNFHRIAMVVVLAILAAIANHLDNYFTFFVGFCFGIEGYFLVHKLIHTRTGARLFKKLVRYHIYHHCRYTDTCFGVTVPWWDDLFRTVPKNPKVTQRIIDFYFDHHEKSPVPLLKPEQKNNCAACKSDFCNHKKILPAPQACTAG